MIRYRLVDNEQAISDLRAGFELCKRKAGADGDADTIIEQIKQQRALWLVEDDVNVVVTNDGDALFIWLCWGKELRKRHAAMWRDLTELAKYYGLKKFRMRSPRRAWRVLLPNAKQVNDFFEEDI